MKYVSLISSCGALFFLLCFVSIRRRHCIVYADPDVSIPIYFARPNSKNDIRAAATTTGRQAQRDKETSSRVICSTPVLVRQSTSPEQPHHHSLRPIQSIMSGGGPIISIARALHGLWESLLVGLGSLYYKIVGRH
ncbi:hypothetical protein MN608_05606 [Microdochium nivale]|nr:hypothetical protein MN608_05606 [Microdochium nivale]